MYAMIYVLAFLPIFMILKIMLNFLVRSMQGFRYVSFSLYVEVLVPYINHFNHAPGSNWLRTFGL